MSTCKLHVVFVCNVVRYMLRVLVLDVVEEAKTAYCWPINGSSCCCVDQCYVGPCVVTALVAGVG